MFLCDHFVQIWWPGLLLIGSYNVLLKLGDLTFKTPWLSFKLLWAKMVSLTNPTVQSLPLYTLLKRSHYVFSKPTDLKGATKLQTEVIFVSATKIGKNTTNILKLLFFIISLHFVTSNQISTYRELNSSLTSSIYFVFLPLEMQKRLEQTKVYHTFSYFVWKETSHKPLKVAAAITIFSGVYVICTIFFDECFLSYVITGRQ